MDNSCIFCKIANHDVDADIVFEDNEVIVFKDIKPSAPVHLLFVPKKHIPSIMDVSDNDKDLLGGLIVRAREVAKEQGLGGYKLIFNVGRDGGQIIDHIHLHLLSSSK